MEDIYIGAAYIVPENSAAHAVYDVDLFRQLEEDISFFANKGKVLLMGDLNSRTGTKMILLTLRKIGRIMIYFQPKRHRYDSRWTERLTDSVTCY